MGPRSIAIVAGVLVLTGSLPAAAQPAKVATPAIRSFQATMDSEIEAAGGPGGTPLVARATGTIYYQEPGAWRNDLKGERMFQGGRDSTQISFKDKPGLALTHNNSTYVRTPPFGDAAPSIYRPQQLAGFAAKADLDLGTKVIDGKAAKGFEIDAKKLDAFAETGPVEIWIDTATNLPIELRSLMQLGPAQFRSTLHDFQWNLELDPKLFDTTPPDGYSEEKMTPPAPQQTAERLAYGLGIYANLCDEYPPGKTPDAAAAQDAMFRKVGIEGRPTLEQMSTARYREIRIASRCLEEIAQLLKTNPDAAYHELSVWPKDGARVLFRWKLDDGQYQVIYGDLRSDSVSQEKLRDLEK